jgi:hypothetical protein
VVQGEDLIECLRYYPKICLEGLRKTMKGLARIEVCGSRFELATS